MGKPGGELKSAMENELQPECKDWLLAEMAENRTKAAKKHKQYCQKELCVALSNQQPLQRHWGSHEILSKLAANPSILDPIAKALEHDSAVEQHPTTVTVRRRLTAREARREAYAQLLKRKE